MGLCCIAYQISTGVGVWGENHPVGWAWDITNFVFWIGIGHAGTLISAILFLTRQKWRTSINRASEAMTLFAVICAGIFPGIHVGRVWMAWFLAPVPWYEGIWPNFRSPLLWDVFAVSTYFTVSVLFWYTGLVPDLATLRDRTTSRVKKFFFTLFALGWRGSNRNWRHYEMAYLILAGISTPLVLSVHSVVSFDFATSIIPGWHTTIFPPYFVAGAIFGGFAMVLTILLPARVLYPQLKDLITPQHIDRMCKIILLTGSIVGYAYMMEFFIAWYGGNPYEQWAFLRNRLADPYLIGPALHITPAPYWWAYWCMITCNVLSPQVFWFKKNRYNLWVVFIIVQFRERGHVVRAVRDHRHVARERFPPLDVAPLSPDLGRDRDVCRDIRDFPFPLPSLHALPADGRHVGNQDRAAGIRSAPRRAGVPCGSRGAQPGGNALKFEIRNSKFENRKTEVRVSSARPAHPARSGARQRSARTAHPAGSGAPAGARPARPINFEFRISNFEFSPIR